MAYTRKTKTTPKKVTAPSEEIPKAQDRALGLLSVRMCVVDEKHEWNYKAANAIDAMEKGKKICKDNGFHFPSQVVVFNW